MYTAEDTWDIAAIFDEENGVREAAQLLLSTKGVYETKVLYDQDDTLTFEFVEGPQEAVDWSKLPDYDFLNNPQAERYG